MSTTISAVQIVTAINVANDLRREFGADIIEDLPKGLPGDQYHCILAKAFNFNCTVDYDSSEIGDYGKASFPVNRKAEAEHLAKILKTKVTPKLSIVEPTVISRYKVDLPHSIAAIAVAFDQHKLPQYEIDLHQAFDQFEAE